MGIFRMNKYIVLLLISDVFTVSGLGLIDPIFAVFAADHVAGGSVSTVGIAVGIFLITKSIIQLPFSWKIDACDDEYDIRWLLTGNVLLISGPIIYFFATDITHVYIAQFLSGIGAGLAYPAWLGLWSTHLDKSRESFEWSFYSTLTGVATAATAVIGAYIAEVYGFKMTFLAVIFLSICGVVSLLYLRSLHYRRTSKKYRGRF